MEKEEKLNRNGRDAEQKQNRVTFRPGNLLYPLPAVLVSCQGADGKANLVTAAWTGTVCTNPPMVSLSLRPERYSYGLIKERKEFVINLVTEELTRAMDYCGVRSGRDCDKWKDCGLTQIPGKTVSCPAVAESPVNIECQVVSVTALGSHDLFLARVTCIQADGRFLKDNGALDLEGAKLIAYSHGAYYRLGEKLGTFGFSVRKKEKTRKKEIARKKEAAGKRGDTKAPRSGEKTEICEGTEQIPEKNKRTTSGGKRYETGTEKASAHHGGSASHGDSLRGKGRQRRKYGSAGGNRGRDRSSVRDAE